MAARLSSWTCNMTAALRQQLLPPPTVALFYSPFCGVFPSLSRRYSRLFLLPIIGQGLRCSSFDFIHSNISWSGFSLTLPHSIWDPSFSTCCSSLECKFLFLFLFCSSLAKMLIKRAFQLEWVSLRSQLTYTHSHVVGLFCGPRTNNWLPFDPRPPLFIWK